MLPLSSRSSLAARSGGGHFTGGQKLFAGQQALAQQVLAKAGAPRQRVVQQLVLHKHAAPRLYAHQALGLQGGYGLAQGVAVDGKAGRQFHLAGQAAGLGVAAVADLGGQGVGNLPPYRYAAAPPGVAGCGLSERHGCFLGGCDRTAL
jgi:hypothetical protein